MTKSYRLVVFDWEGTLGDMVGQILNTVLVEAKRLHFGEFDAALARQSVTFGLAKMIKKIYPQLTNAQLEQLHSAVQYALATEATEAYLIPGAKRTLERLQQAGIDMAIATNMGKLSLQRALQTTGLTDFFITTRSAGQAPEKPCPQMLEEIIEICGVTHEQTLMVGDSLTDIEMATQIGVDAIGFDFYHQQEKQLRLAGALLVFDDYEPFNTYLNLPNGEGGLL
jgi:phosphoglycolate phosphatase